MNNDKPASLPSSPRVTVSFRAVAQARSGQRIDQHRSQSGPGTDPVSDDTCVTPTSDRSSLAKALADVSTETILDQGRRHSLVQSDTSSKVTPYNIDRLGFIVTKDGSSETVALFDMAERFVGVETTEVRPGKRKADENSTESPTSVTSSDDDSERASKRPRQPKFTTSTEAMLVGCMLVKETRKLAEARNEQLRLMAMSQIIEAQLKRMPPVTNQDTPQAHPIITTATKSDIKTTLSSKASQRPQRRSSRVASLHKKHAIKSR
ncbi:hypothetical protein BGZ54_009109 [Gamsiella multidivaricata]|nr:hypothetical protein BGZ54_009109 [Gamsiella multidivaricata]